MPGSDCASRRDLEHRLGGSTSSVGASHLTRYTLRAFFALTGLKRRPPVLQVCHDDALGAEERA